MTKRQFELRIDAEIESWMRQVYELLVAHQDLAYSTEELLHEVLGDSPGIHREKFGRALETLTKLGAIEKRQVHDTEYYAFDSQVNTQSWELDLSSI
ncbi:MAG: hypothetical protein ACE5Q6_06355 [Dehalococcoidia bacterium]